MTKGRRRLRRIQGWLESEFPGDFPVRVRVEKMPRGYTDCCGAYHPPEAGNGLIRINKKDSLSSQISTLIHEWVHYRIDPHAEAVLKTHGGHTNDFYLELGRIERAYWLAMENVLKPKGGR